MFDRTPIVTNSPDETFDLGRAIGAELTGGEVILLTGGLGAGKTLLTKGVLEAVGYDVDEVTSPSFALVNLYPAKDFDVYHIDLWRSGDNESAAFSVGLDEILEDETAVVLIEWAERLRDYRFESTVIRIDIRGNGDDPRTISIERSEQNSPVRV